mmetsp:Transcript_43197/g.123110  ORF Transcript_43197/g.123110 Transcript_43197/m.123110 type:complete len:211 (-) Transcript_43197:329-961(-)
MTLSSMPSMCFSSRSLQSAASSLRSRPVSTRKGRKRLPMALCTRAAATLESTPPLTAPTTWPSPSLPSMLSTCSLAKSCMFQLPLQPQSLSTKFCTSWPPQGVCVTSGWNCTPHIRRSRLSTAANSQLGVCAICSKPAGSCVTLSPWLIQTLTASPSTPSKSREGPRARFPSEAPPSARSPRTVTSAWPNSRFWPGSTLPPKLWHISWSP